MLFENVKEWIDKIMNKTIRCNSNRTKELNEKMEWNERVDGWNGKS